MTKPTKIFVTTVEGIRINITTGNSVYDATISSNQGLRREKIVQGALTERLAIEAAAQVLKNETEMAALRAATDLRT